EWCRGEGRGARGAGCWPGCEDAIRTRTQRSGTRTRTRAGHQPSLLPLARLLVGRNQWSYGIDIVNTKEHTMAYRKTAIAVPAEILDEVDRAAQARGESRSRYIVRILGAAVRARRDAEVTQKLDALFADEIVR